MTSQTLVDQAAGATAVAMRSGLTAAELEQGRLYLTQVECTLIGAIRGLSDAQWNFTPGADRWSIAQVTEHIIFVLERVSGPTMQRLAQGPAPAENRDWERMDAIVIYQFPNRLTKFTAPESALPTMRFGSAAEAIEALVSANATLADCLDTVPDLRRHELPAPPMSAVSKGVYQTLDGYQWILAAAAHGERHVKQILEVKAEPGFPVN